MANRFTKYIRDFFDAPITGQTHTPHFSETRAMPGQHDELDHTTLKDQYRNDGLARKLVAKPAEDMTRNGWRIVIPDDEAKQAVYQKAMDGLQLTTELAQEFIYSRLFGDGYAQIGLMEVKRTSMDKPVDPMNIKDVAFVHAFSPDLVDQYQINDDPTDIHFGKESNITVQPTQTGDVGGGVPTSIKIDRSRYFHQTFGRLEGEDYGNSILNTCMDALKVVNSAQYSVGKIFYELTLKVFKSDEVANLPTDKRVELMYKLSEAVTTEGVMAIDSSESYEKIGTPLSGVGDIIDFAWQSLAAASSIPKSVLTGQEAGTLTGAQYDVINYYDQVKSQQEQQLKPQIMQIVRYLMYASDVADGYEDPDSFTWDIEFNPLWDADDETQSKVLLNNVQAANQAVSGGLLDPDEARTMLSGQKGAVKSTATDSLDETELTDAELKQYKAIISKIRGK